MRAPPVGVFERVRRLIIHLDLDATVLVIATSKPHKLNIPTGSGLIVVDDSPRNGVSCRP